MKFVAILSTTVLPNDGTYSVRTLRNAERQEVLNNLSEIQHYIGHPDTKKIVEALGAIPAPSKLFKGLEEGEECLCFPIKQGLSTRATEGFTAHQAIQEVETLDVRVIRRVKVSGSAQRTYEEK